MTKQELNHEFDKERAIQKARQEKGRLFMINGMVG